jgi:hypothetical protein
MSSEDAEALGTNGIGLNIARKVLNRSLAV